MKTVFKSEEIAHVWAHRSAPHGRSPGNLSFDGDAIKSYATVIGRRIKDRGREAFVLDCYSFSSSTAKSQGHVRRAIPDSAKVFRLEIGTRGQALNFSGLGIAKHFEERADKVAAAAPSRYARMRAEQYQHATALLERARDALDFFGYGTARLDKKIAARKAGEATAAETLAEYGRKLKESAERKAKRDRLDRIKRSTEEATKFLAETRQPLLYRDTLNRLAALELLPDEMRARVVEKVTRENNEYLRRWRENAPGLHPVPHSLPVMLRAEGSEMVTSMGARVPLADAERTHRFAMLARAKGWHKNGETHAVGSYQLDAVNEFGVVAGCHRIAWEEIECFAKSQGWKGGAS